MNKLSEEEFSNIKYLIEFNPKLINWTELLIKYELSEDFLTEIIDEKKIDYLRVREIFRYQKLSENFIEKYIDKATFYWQEIFQGQDLSIDFLEKHTYHINFKWRSYCHFGKVNIDIINHFYNNIDWFWLSGNINLTEDIVRKYYSKLNIDEILRQDHRYKYLSKEFMKKIKVFL